MPPTNSQPAPQLTGEEFTVLLNAGGALGTPKQLTGFRPVVIVPAGYEAKPLEQAFPPLLPNFVEQKVTATDAASFASYVNDYASPEQTRLFLKPSAANGLLDAPSFLAVLDYHSTADEDPNRCAHRVSYACPLSLEWQTWAGIHGRALTQREFVDFVDENMPDIIEPAAADVRELALNFASHSDVKFASKVDPRTGGVSLTYQEETDAGTAAGKIKAFDRMILQIPVFRGEVASEIHARVQWAPRDGKLAITVKLHRASEVKRVALETVRSSISGACKLPVLNAWPE